MTVLVGPRAVVAALVSPEDDPKYLVVDDVLEPSLVVDWNKANDSDKQAPRLLERGGRPSLKGAHMGRVGVKCK